MIDILSRSVPATSATTDAPPVSSPYAVPSKDGYITQLSPMEQQAFLQWVQVNGVPYDPSPYADYDMPGFWKGLVSGDPNAKTAIDPNDKRLHFTDHWKTPYHKTFSRESKYASPDAPYWNDKDQLVDKNGKVVFDDRANNGE